MTNNQSPTALKEAPFPTYLTDASEVPQPVQDVPLWSENYLSQVYDPETEVGFFFHLSRMPFNYNIWECVFTCFLPGDRFLVVRDFSWDSNPKGPGSNALRFEVVEPFKKWSKQFKGAALLATGEELRAGTVPDESHVYVEMDLTFEATAPVFDIGHMGTQFWAHAHYEQHGRYTGTVTFKGEHLGHGSERYEINGHGIRDHSVGARDVNKMKNHAWLSGEFPSGRVFMLMELVLKPGQGENFTYIVVGDGKKFWRVELTNSPPIIDDVANLRDGYELHFEGPNGPSVIKAEILQQMPYSFTGPNEWVLGTSPKVRNLVVESQTRFEWDGEVGYGLTERSIAY